MRSVGVFVLSFTFHIAISSVSAVSLLDKLQGYVSRNDTAAASTGTQQSPFLGQLQNSSFGQFVQGGIDYYNGAKANNQSGADILTDGLSSLFANSTFGETVQSGIEQYNNWKSGNGTADVSVLANFMPFFANVSVEARADFNLILPKIPTMTIAQFETAVNEWAAKYGYTDEVNKFNERAKNVTKNAEDEATSIVSTLPNVLENLKAIGNDYNQTFMQMHNTSFSYIMSLDEPTRQIVFILFKALLPPQLRNSGCSGPRNGGGGISGFFQQAQDFFRGGDRNGSGGGVGGNYNNNNNGSAIFASAQNFFNSLSNRTDGSSGSPSTMNLSLLNNFLRTNNVTEDEFNNSHQGAAGFFGGARIGVVGNAQVQSDESGMGIQLMSEAAVETETPKPKKAKNANKNQNNKKKTTTTTAEPPVASIAVL